MEKRASLLFRQKDRCALRPFRENRNYTAISPLGEGHKTRYVRQQGKALAHAWAQAMCKERLRRRLPCGTRRRCLRCSIRIQKRSLFFTRRQRPRGTNKGVIALFGAFSGRATSTAAVGVVHDSFISYSDGRRHRWSHNPFCVNRHDIFQNSTAEQRQFNETPSQRHVFGGKRHNPAASIVMWTGVMKPRARRSCTQAARRADAATR